MQSLQKLQSCTAKQFQQHRLLTLLHIVHQLTVALLNLQEETLSTDDDYNFMSSPSRISLVSGKSTGDPGLNSEPQSSTDLLQPLYDPFSYFPITSQPAVSHLAVTMQSVPAVIAKCYHEVNTTAHTPCSHHAHCYHAVNVLSRHHAANAHKYISVTRNLSFSTRSDVWFYADLQATSSTITLHQSYVLLKRC